MSKPPGWRVRLTLKQIWRSSPCRNRTRPCALAEIGRTTDARPNTAQETRKKVFL
jgi:hypothetical protein